LKSFISRVMNCFKPSEKTPVEIHRANQLVAAIDAGGIPLDPARIVRIAEDIGLEVSRNARTEDTIERIRMAIRRY